MSSPRGCGPSPSARGRDRPRSAWLARPRPRPRSDSARTSGAVLDLVLACAAAARDPHSPRNLRRGLGGAAPARRSGPNARLAIARGCASRSSRVPRRPWGSPSPQGAFRPAPGEPGPLPVGWPVSPVRPSGRATPLARGYSIVGVRGPPSRPASSAGSSPAPGHPWFRRPPRSRRRCLRPALRHLPPAKGAIEGLVVLVGEERFRLVGRVTVSASRLSRGMCRRSTHRGRRRRRRAQDFLEVARKPG